MTTPIDQEVRSLYQSILNVWNERNAESFSELFTIDGECVGFDGTEMQGTVRIRADLAGIFADHRTGRYVAKVRTVRSIAPNVAVLHAVVGMVPRGSSELNAAVNAIQLMVA